MNDRPMTSEEFEKCRREFSQKMGKTSWVKIFKDKPEEISAEMLWRLYVTHAYEGKDVSSVQYKETKKAFFIGFNECFKVLSDFASDLPEEKACEMLTKLAKELNEFVRSTLERDVYNKKVDPSGT